MEKEKVKYLIYMINYMNIEDKLILAICISQSKLTSLIYNTKENYDKFNILMCISILSNIGCKLYSY